jgi:tRNA (adenine57-N1/adenine58-N1)-methyltransferase
LSYPFLALEPSTSDLIEQIKRTTQIMYPKDIGYILVKLGVMPGVRLVEAGTGSGGLTVALARAIGPQGKLYSYEIREDILRLAQGNLGRLGLTTRVEFKRRDIADGFDETDVDAMFLDVRQPWRYLGSVEDALRPSGFLGAILPTTNQVSRLVDGLETAGGFGYIEVEELLLRSYKPVPQRLRPVDRMVAHTGYLVFARRIDRELVEGDYWLDRKRRKFERAQAQSEGEGDAA